jgi:uncharacterized protein (UPF0276 family)
VRVGLGWRAPLARWLATRPAEVECLEITAEHFFDGGTAELATLAATWPLYVHGLGLSLGTPGPLDADTLERFAVVADAADAAWISEHVAFTRAGGIDLGHLNPVPRTAESLAALAEHSAQLKARCGRPLILENICSPLDPGGELAETTFLSRLCEAADCGLLLDVTNLYINGQNHGYDPRAWLAELDPERIVQLHIVGYAQVDGRYEDTHSAPVQEPLLELLAAVLDFAPVRAVILERDDAKPDADEISAELARIKAVCDAA